jgi:hypothetical protein
VTNYKLLSIASKKDAGLLMVTFITWSKVIIITLRA